MHPQYVIWGTIPVKVPPVFLILFLWLMCPEMVLGLIVHGTVEKLMTLLFSHGPSGQGQRLQGISLMFLMHQ